MLALCSLYVHYFFFCCYLLVVKRVFGCMTLVTVTPPAVDCVVEEAILTIDVVPETYKTQQHKYSTNP